MITCGQQSTFSAWTLLQKTKLASELCLIFSVFQFLLWSIPLKLFPSNLIFLFYLFHTFIHLSIACLEIRHPRMQSVLCLVGYCPYFLLEKVGIIVSFHSQEGSDIGKQVCLVKSAEELTQDYCRSRRTVSVIYLLIQFIRLVNLGLGVYLYGLVLSALFGRGSHIQVRKMFTTYQILKIPTIFIMSANQIIA